MCSASTSLMSVWYAAQLRLGFSSRGLNRTLELIDLVEAGFAFPRPQHLDRTRNALDHVPFDRGPHPHTVSLRMGKDLGNVAAATGFCDSFSPRTRWGGSR